MEWRYARMGDLPQLESLFQAVNVQMERDGIQIWDEVYPAIAFPEDIRHKRLYLLMEGSEINAAFALCPWPQEADGMGWAEPEAAARCLERLAVRVDHWGSGLGASALEQAAELAREQGAQYLRLLVAEFNRPAIALYQKCGFRQVEGIYNLALDDSFTLREYGFERKL